MYLSQLRAVNFRSLQDVQIVFKRGMNVIAGKNNAGKSNIIEALNVLLGEKWPTYLEFEHRHFFRQSSESLPAEKFLLAVCLRGGKINNDILVRENIKASCRVISDFPRFDDFDAIEQLCNDNSRVSWFSGVTLASLLERASSVWLILLVPREERRKDRIFCAVVQEKVETTGEIKSYLLQKFPQELRDALLTTARIPSFRDPVRELKVTNYSWYGKLIKNLYEARNEWQKVQVLDAQTDLSNVYREIFEGVTEEVCTVLSQAIFHYGISFEAGPFTIDDSHKNVTIFVDDGINSPCFDKGSGIQSALIIALFGYYCSRFHQSGSLLLAEEPELYLHPHARRAIEGQLLKFANSSDERRCRQVIITTHAVEFIRSTSPSSLVLVSKDASEGFSSVVQLSARDLNSDLQKRWPQIVGSKNSEMFFSDHAILVEGGEEYILGPLADLVFSQQRWLDFKNVSLVRADGKMQFTSYANILSKFGISYSILTDLDFLRKGAMDFQHALSENGRNALNRLMSKLGELKKEPKATNIKKAMTEASIDWMLFYHALEKIVGENGLSEIQQTDYENAKMCWGKLKERIERPSLEKIINGDPEMEACCNDVIDAFRKVGIFILRKGQIEDYYSEKTLEATSDESSKDRCAVTVGEFLKTCDNLSAAGEWIVYDELFELLQFVESVIATGGVELLNSSGL